MTRFNQLSDQYLDGAANPLALGKIKFEVPNGGTDKDTFADQDLTITNSNPVILSATGVPPNIFFNGEAKAFLLDSDDVQIRELDPVPGGSSALDAFADYSASITYSIEDIVRGSSERYFKSITNANLGNDPVTTNGFWIEINFIHTWDTAYTFSIDFVAVASDSNLYISRVNSNVGNDPVSSPTEWRILTETGAVVGPGSSTDNAVVRFDTTTGLLLQNSVVLLNDSGVYSGIADLGSVPTMDLNGGSIDGAIIGAAVAAAITGTLITATTGLNLGNENLADYDEGTFTPVLTDGTNDATHTNQVGNYTRTGNRVEGEISILISSLGSVSGHIFIKDLPFTSNSGANTEGSISVGFATNLAIAAGQVITGFVEVNATRIDLRLWDDGLGVTNFLSTEFSGDGNIKLSFNYMV